MGITADWIYEHDPRISTLFLILIFKKYYTILFKEICMALTSPYKTVYLWLFFLENIGNN